MPLIKRFEEIKAWQEARILTRHIYALTQKGSFAKDFGLRDQIQRVAVSVMTNIAEGFDCDSRVELARFLSISRRSAVEDQSLHYTALDIGYISQEDFETIFSQAEKIKALIGGFREAIKKRSTA